MRSPRQCVVHCRPADQIDPLTAFVLQELAAQVARALAKPFGRSVRNLKEPAPIDVRLEPVDDDLELSLHGQLRLLTSRPGPEHPVSPDSEAKRRVTPMSASRQGHQLPAVCARVAPVARSPLPPCPSR